MVRDKPRGLPMQIGYLHLTSLDFTFIQAAAKAAAAR
jgi:hypothetical protein